MSSENSYNYVWMFKQFVKYIVIVLYVVLSPSSFHSSSLRGSRHVDERVQIASIVKKRYVYVLSSTRTDTKTRVDRLWKVAQRIQWKGIASYSFSQYRKIKNRRNEAPLYRRFDYDANARQTMVRDTSKRAHHRIRPSIGSKRQPGHKPCRANRCTAEMEICTFGTHGWHSISRR